ncbi:MAG: hypothetical protein IPP47_10940 [Bryobacterales bacterium]|nr:hypothetical protein [Bryobacterales bacterium]
MKLLLAFLLLAGTLTRAAEPPVYWLLWFDTEDYVEPASDDAALRLAQDLTQRGIRATFKIVGEKARVLEQRKRTDVLRALAAHDIGYHSNYHSIHPTPAEYLAPMGMLDGAAEFARREEQGLRDLQRIFGVTPSCYGQPGNSWAPQANLTLRQWGVPVYMDDGSHVAFDQQPFWYGGMLYVFNLGPHTMRTGLDNPAGLDTAKRSFDAAVAALRQRGGGVAQTYYHPTEFVTTEFWDGVNFRHGANPERSSWRMPRRRTAESSEQAYRLFLAFVDHVRQTPGVRIVTARDIPQFFEPRDSAAPPAAARRLAESIDAHDGHSAAELLLTLLGLPAQYVDGPLRRVDSNYAAAEIPRAAWVRAVADAADFVRQTHRLPDSVAIGSQRLSLPDFAATLAGVEPGAPVARVRRGRLDQEKRIGSNAAKLYDWVIHPAGFAPEGLMELARLQAWTLKPARLR